MNYFFSYPSAALLVFSTLSAGT